MRQKKPGRPAREKLLVVGVDTMAGGNLAATLGGRLRTTGLHQRARFTLEPCATRPCDLADRGALAQAVREERPHWIVYSSALGRSSWDSEEQSIDVGNQTEICKTLVRAATDCGAALTVLVSDAIFCGPRMFHDEKAPARGRSPRADAVRAIELVLRRSGALVVRSHVYGWSPAGTPPGFAEQIWLELTQSDSLPELGERHATPILATDLAELLHIAYLRRLNGICHITGAERVSARRFAAELTAAFGLEGRRVPEDLHCASQCDGDYVDETSLNTRRARRELQRPMPMLREGLERFAAQYAEGFRAQLLACGRQAKQQGHAA